MKDERKDLFDIIRDELESITETMCDHYCKWPAEFKEPDELVDRVCEHCPLASLLG